MVTASTGTTSRLIHSNRPNGAFLPRRCVSQPFLRTTASRRSCILSIRSSYDASRAMVIDHSTVAGQIIDEIKIEVSRMKKSIGAVPGLAVIVVGDASGYDLSETYEVCCMLVRMEPIVVRLAEDSSEEEVLKRVSRLNDDPCVHGILVQLPLPSDLDVPDGFRAVGDIGYREVCKVASAITPIDAGGKALMTLTMLLSNVLTSAKRFHNFI